MSRRRLVRFAIALAVGVVALCAVVCVASYVTGITMWAVLSEEEAEHTPPPIKKEGARVAPLRDLDFDSGDWAAYVLVALDDYQELWHDLPGTCLKLTDREELKRIQRGFVATYTGADTVTVTSSIVFVRDGKIAWESGIVLHGRDLHGFQTREWGLLEPDDPAFTSRFVDRFHRVYWPVCVV